MSRKNKQRYCAYRKLWYIKKNKMRRYRILLGVTVVVLSVLLLLCLIDINFFPGAKKAFESDLKDYTYTITENMLQKNFGEVLDTSKLIELQRDSKGSIIAVKTNSISLVRLTEDISKELKRELVEDSNLDLDKLYLPLHTNGFLQSNPLRISLGSVKVKDIDVEFLTEYMPSESGGTRQLLLLNYSIRYGTIKGNNVLEFNYILCDTFLPSFYDKN